MSSNMKLDQELESYVLFKQFGILAITNLYADAAISHQSVYYFL